MSIRLMTAAWALELSSTDKLVLLALADWSNDDGLCWPSMAQLAKKSGLTDRAIRTSVGRLKDAGHLTRDEVPGKGVRYTIHPGTTFPPEARSARNDMPPEPASPRNETTETPERRSANTSVTTNTSHDASHHSKTRARKSNFELPSDIPADEWAAFEEMRRAIRKPMTDGARNRAVERLRKLRDEDGWPPGEVLSNSTLNNYQGLFPPPREKRHAQPARSENGFFNACVDWGRGGSG